MLNKIKEEWLVLEYKNKGKGLVKRLLSGGIVGAMMFSGIIPYASADGGWDPNDEITVDVRVYDSQTNIIYEDVGQVKIKKGASDMIQSEEYRIPDLSTFTDNEFGRVIKVTGNWYFPKGDGSVGTNTEWSCNNSFGSMTYWVDGWHTVSGPSAGGGTNGSSDGEEIGSGSRYKWTETIVYHSNYPDGTDYEQSVTYNVSSFTTTRAEDLKNYTDVGFSAPEGYKYAYDHTNSWAIDSPDSDIVKNMFGFSQANQGGTTHVYANWVKDPDAFFPDDGKEVGTDVQEITLTEMDGEIQHSKRIYFTGDDAVFTDCDDSGGKQFVGWDTDASADSVVYDAGDSLTMVEDEVVYAVYEDADNVILTYDANGGSGEPLPDDSGIAEGTEATFTVSSTEPTKPGFIFKGWADTKEALEPDYKAGNEIKTTTDKTIYAVWEAEVTDTIVLTYDANGGSGAPSPDDSGILEGESATFTVSSQEPTKDNAKFLGWADTDVASTPDYVADDEIITTTDKIIYAVWEQVDDGNDKVSEPGMDKKANGKEEIGVVAPGEVIDFTLNSHIGTDIEGKVQLEGGVYSGTYDLIFHDKLSGDITFNSNSLKVTVGGKELSSGQYSLNESPADGHTFDLTIDVVKLLNEKVFNYEDAGKVAVVVSYTGTVGGGAIDGSEISNSATVNDSVEDIVTGDVDNEKPIPPLTGGSGTIWFTIVGLGIMSGATITYIVRRKSGVR